MNLDDKLLIIDAGTTNTKTLYVNREIRKYEIIKSHLPLIKSKEYILDEIDKIIIFGSNSKKINVKDKQTLIYLDEIMVLSHIAKIMNIDKSFIVSMGTGTSISYYDHSESRHITGTGIGGGTLINLGRKLLDVKEVDEIEKIASSGNINNVNIFINDLNYNKNDWLPIGITATNFGKVSLSKSDIAIGLYYMITEPVISILKPLVQLTGIKTIIFCGGVTTSPIVRNIIINYAEIFGFNPLFTDNAQYIGCESAYNLILDKI